MVRTFIIKHLEVREDIHAFFKDLCEFADLNLINFIDMILRDKMNEIKRNHKIIAQKENSIKFDPKREISTEGGDPSTDSHIDQKIPVPGKVKITNEKSEVPGKITLSPDKKKTPEKIDIKSLQKKLQESQKKEEEDWQKNLIGRIIKIGSSVNNKPKGRYDK